MIRIFKKGNRKKFDLILKIVFKGLESIKYPWTMLKPPGRGGSFLLEVLIGVYKILVYLGPAQRGRLIRH